jgi:single-stranded-DNA-specific exonuclease
MIQTDPLVVVPVRPAGAPTDAPIPTVLTAADLSARRVPAQWGVRVDPEEAVVAALATGLHLPSPVCRLLAKRGFVTVPAAAAFLDPKLSALHSPLLMLGMDKAVARLHEALVRGEVLQVAGDYDVDGITSSAIMTKGLRRIAALTAGRGMALTVHPFLPIRKVDGFGLRPRAVEKATEVGATLIVTVDNGIAAHEAIRLARSRQIDVLVTDHHLADNQLGLPDASVIVNPNQPGCPYPFKHISGAVVAFKVISALATALEIPRADRVALCLGLLDLTALGAICDVMPLHDELRAIVTFGLRQMRHSEHLGLRVLLPLARQRRGKEVQGNPEITDLDAVRHLLALPLELPTVRDCGFGLGPRLNAAGRLAEAELAFDLLMVEHDALRAYDIAKKLDAMNKARQRLVEKMFGDCLTLLAAQGGPSPTGILLKQADWHYGVVGIVASRLVEKFHAPTILCGEYKPETVLPDGTVQPAIYKGSGRSPEGNLSLHAAVVDDPSIRSRLVGAGGHEAACGITIADDQWDAFVEAFHAHADARLTSEQRTPVLTADLALTISQCAGAAGITLAESFSRLEPFGKGNTQPQIVATNVEVVSAQALGQGEIKTLKLAVRDPGSVETLVLKWWRNGAMVDQFAFGDRVDVMFTLSINEWNGRRTAEGEVVDVRVTGRHQGLLFVDVTQEDDFRRAHLLRAEDRPTQ